MLVRVCVDTCVDVVVTGWVDVVVVTDFVVVVIFFPGRLTVVVTGAYVDVTVMNWTAPLVEFVWVPLFTIGGM